MEHSLFFYREARRGDSFLFAEEGHLACAIGQGASEAHTLFGARLSQDSKMKCALDDTNDTRLS